MNTEQSSETTSSVQSDETPVERSKATAPAAKQEQLHKPPVLLFLLPLVVIVIIAYLTK